MSETISPIMFQICFWASPSWDQNSFKTLIISRFQGMYCRALKTATLTPIQHTVPRGRVLGVPWHPQILANQLTLSHPEGGGSCRLCPLNNTGSPDFSNLDLVSPIHFLLCSGGIECPSEQSDICCLVVRFLLQVRRRRPYSNPKVQRNRAKTQTPQTPQALPTREFCWICLDELVAGDGSYPGGWPWQGHQNPWYSSSHVFKNFESTNLWHFFTTFSLFFC